MIFCMV